MRKNQFRRISSSHACDVNSAAISPSQRTTRKEVKHMRYLVASFILASVGLLPMSVLAADSDGSEANKAQDGAARAEIREKIIKEFDKDGDGKLSDEERQEARQKMRELMGERHRERGDNGPGSERRRRHEDGHDRDGH